MQQNLKQFGQVLHISEIYQITGNPNENKFTILYENISERFSKAYGEQPYNDRQNIIKVPTLSGFPGNVICFQLNRRDVIMAFSLANNKITITSSQPSICPQMEIPLDAQAKFPSFDESNSKGSNLLKALVLGYKAAFTNHQNYRGFKVFIDINILPQKLGFGFHNCCSIGICMITLFANKLPMNKMDVQNNLINLKKTLLNIQNPNPTFQQLIGIKGQLCFLDINGEKLFKQGFAEIFYPYVDNYSFIIADTLTPEPKLFTLQKRINKRKGEILLGLNILKQNLNVEATDVNSIFELQELLSYNDEEMIEFVSQSWENREYTQNEIEVLCGEPIEKIFSKLPYLEQIVEQNTTFNPYSKLIYLLKEKSRMIKGVHILSSQAPVVAKATLLGQLMNESYNDGRQLLGIDSKQIQDIYQELQSFGALGIKQIGTTWGGALIALYPQEKTEQITEYLKDNYYNNPNKKLMVSDDLSTYVFSSKPSMGSIFLDPQYEIWY